MPTKNEIIREQADSLAIDFITQNTKLPIDGQAHHKLVSILIDISCAYVPELNQANAEIARLRSILAYNGIDL